MLRLRSATRRKGKVRGSNKVKWRKGDWEKGMVKAPCLFFCGVCAGFSGKGIEFVHECVLWH